jgi:hypothetical protein
VGEARKLKYCSKIVKGLKEKEKPLKEQEHRKRVEMEPPMLKIMEASDKLELEFESCEVPLSDKLDVPPYCYVPQKCVYIIIILTLFSNYRYYFLNCFMIIDT